MVRFRYQVIFRTPAGRLPTPCWTIAAMDFAFVMLAESGRCHFWQYRGIQTNRDTSGDLMVLAQGRPYLRKCLGGSFSGLGTFCKYPADQTLDLSATRFGFELDIALLRLNPVQRGV